MEERGPFCLTWRVNKLNAFCISFRSLCSNHFRASASRKLGREQTKGMKGKGEGREGNPTFAQYYWKRLLHRLKFSAKCTKTRLLSV